jgi:hypothetical protein
MVSSKDLNIKEIYMASYTVKLTPDVVNMSTEGSMDTVVDGVSIQRTMEMVLVSNSGYKMVGKLKDGDTFDDVIADLGDYSNLVVV